MPEKKKKVVVERERTWKMKEYPRVNSCQHCLIHDQKETPAVVCRLFIPIVVGFCERHYQEFRQHEHDMSVDLLESIARILTEYHTCLKEQIARLEAKRGEKRST